MLRSQPERLRHRLLRRHRHHRHRLDLLRTHNDITWVNLMAKPSIQPQPPLWSLASTPALSMPTLLEPPLNYSVLGADLFSQKVNPSPSATPSPPPIQNKPPPPQRSLPHHHGHQRRSHRLRRSGHDRLRTRRCLRSKPERLRHRLLRRHRHHRHRLDLLRTQ